MSEEDSFWCLIGIVKSFINVYNFDMKESADLS